MKKILLGLGSVTSIMPISAIIACGNPSNETPKPPTSQEDDETQIINTEAISNDIKKALESAIFISNKDNGTLSKLILGENKTWSEVKEALGISVPKKDGAPIFSEESLNNKDIKISFSKIRDNSDDSKKSKGADKEVTLTIVKDNTNTVEATLNIKSTEKSSATIELSKIRNKIYYWKDAPDGLKKKDDNESVTLNELGISKESILINTKWQLEQSTQLTYKVAKKFNTPNNEITLITKVNYNNTEEKTKEITINYNFLTFEAVKNATAKIANGILAISKESSKIDAWVQIDKLTWEKDSDKKLFKNYFDYSAQSFKEVYYMIKFMLAATDSGKIKLGTFGVVSEKDGQALTPSDKYLLLESKIFNSKFDIKETAKGIISKFSGDDTDLNYSIVKLGGTVNKQAKKLNKGVMWSSASPSMGGDETVSYIINKIGYTLV